MTDNLKLNSVLYVPKTYGNFNMPPSFATILFSALQERKLTFKVVKSTKNRFDDILTVVINGKLKSVTITGSTSVKIILKKLKLENWNENSFKSV